MKSIFKKPLQFTLSILAIVTFCTGIASAHVTVKPSTSATGAWETYTMKVPVEKDVPTTKVSLKIPSGVELEQYQPVPGWTFSEEKDTSGKVTSVTWTATGEGILSGQFQQFTFVAKNPKDTGKINWDAYQYYKDGSIVEWTGNEGEDTPHSITEIMATPAADEHDADHTDQTATTEKKDAEAESVAASTGIQQTPLILSILSAVLSLAALLVALRKKR
ncbi:YcnI family copper-binding membrane protein [Bacillus sp. OTU530]|uniref:YcnI family copper-binding membrane protein n=1 Tax=Bacillus sp. OTU530 TaxID=3043862 RepID=UPI00313F2593